jgi:uncharacterized protein (TIGR02284 family)
MITEDRKHAIGTLKGLVEICRDGQEGFREAAENIENNEYKVVFQNYAQQRGMFASELESEIRRLGGDEDTSNLEGMWNDVVGAAHRTWLNLKAAITSGDAKAILNECETGEDAAVRAYQSALDDREVPLEISSLIRNQYAAVKEAHDRIRSLRNLERLGS